MNLLEKIPDISIVIPALKSSSFADIFRPHNDSLFGALDANLEAWLPRNFPESPETKVSAYKLLEPLNNREPIEQVGGENSILEKKFSLHHKYDR